MQADWRPGASIQMLRKRAALLADIRTFFAERDVLEVETPLLARAGVTDPHLLNATTSLHGPDGRQVWYLQTSPEYAMKRLLAAGSGCIFQIARVVRDDETGRYHNPEFTMLEWYRVGFDEHQLMDEIEQLLGQLLQTRPAQRLTYQQTFLQATGVDPLAEDGTEMLRQWLLARNPGDWVAHESDPDVLMQLAMSHYIEPSFEPDTPTFIYDFPASQAALADLHPTNPKVARRFELYLGGIELANGFYELRDAAIQACRFAADNKQREQNGTPSAPVDQFLLDALQHGLPQCAGVALGIDRLLMVASGADHISAVQAFSIDRA